MKIMNKMATLGMVMGVATAVNAAQVDVSSDITTSQTWTADNTYNLTDQIFVKNGATLTIEAGTTVASQVTANGGGSLAVTRGSKVFVKGTKDNPVIMTSIADVATWTGSNIDDNGTPADAGDDIVIDQGDRTTGAWRPAAQEWGNLTIMGRAYISENAIIGNTATFGNNIAIMEGLNAPPDNPPTNQDVIYGGTDDDDDSGSVSYLSLRYGGRVIGAANELNGISMGGIGRETDLAFIEIMNNIDDGIEIWGGTANIKNCAIWNIGDDSFDLDQGYRGKAQNLFIVQGYSVSTGGAKSGSGVGNNAFEIDGAEADAYQPVTTATIYNVTVVGNPLDSGNFGVQFKDNARVQIRNSIFMDRGGPVIGSNGDYATGGTLSFADTWTTPAGTHSTVNNGGLTNAQLDPFYQAQTTGFLNEMSGCIFYRNGFVNAYNGVDGTDTVGGANTVTVSGGSSAFWDNIVDTSALPNPTNLPIQSITRGPVVVAAGDGTNILPVATINPLPANAALTLVTASPAPNDGFFSAQAYRGAFSPNNNWALDWTAAEAFGFMSGNQAAEPAISVLLTGTVTFATVNGVTYDVMAQDPDTGTVWYTIGTVVGDGTTQTFVDPSGLTGGRNYRVCVQ